MTTTATPIQCPCVASTTVRCTKHVRTIVTVEQAAELNELYTAWILKRNPEITPVDLTVRLRSANWQSCPPELFGQAKEMLEAWLA